MKNKKLNLLKKKALAIGTALIMMLSLTSCKSENSNDEKKYYGIIIEQNKVLIIEADAVMGYAPVLEVDDNKFYNIMMYKCTEEELEALIKAIAPEDATITYYKDIDPNYSLEK